MEKWKGYLGLSKTYGIFASVFILGNIADTGNGNGLAVIHFLPFMGIIVAVFWFFIGSLGTILTRTIIKVNILILFYNWFFWSLSYIASNISDLRYKLFSTLKEGFSGSILIAIICSAVSLISSLITKSRIDKKEKANEKQEYLSDFADK